MIAGHWKESVYAAFQAGPVMESELSLIIGCRKGSAVVRLRNLGWPVKEIGKIPTLPIGRPRKLYVLDGI